MDEEPVAHHPNLTQRGGTFYLRLRVPLDLVPTLGKTHLVRSLRTKDRRRALEAFRTEQGRAQRDFELARAHREALASVEAFLRAGRLDKLAAADIEALVTRWFTVTVQQVARAGADRATDIEPDWDEVLDDARATETRLTSPNPEEWAPYVENVAGQILIAAGAPREASGRSKIKRAVQSPKVDRETAQYHQLTSLVRRGLIALSRNRLANLTGDQIGSRDPVFTSAGALPQEKPARSLDGLIAAFESDPGRIGRSGKTTVDYGLVFTALREVLGADADIARISRDDIKRVRSLFLALPPNATKRFRGKTLTQAAEAAARDGFPVLRTKTVNEHISKVATLMNWAVREEWLTKNPASGLAIDGSADSKRREPFSTAQLNAIFQAPLFTGCTDDEAGYAKPGAVHPRRSRFWLPVICLFHGLRLNEAAQLSVDDIQDRDGLPIIAVRAAQRGQRVKSKAGTRVVPLHPEILALGFLDFVEKAREAGAARLFPELRQDARGYHSDAFQKWFSRFLASCGAARDGTSFHSFRHGWADRLREAGVPEDRRRALGGWADTGVDAGYGKGFPTRMLAADIASVAYPGLTLNHLGAAADK